MTDCAPMDIVVIEGSPRRGGNTAQLAALMTERLRQSGACPERFSVAEQYFAPCNGCNACLKSGECVLVGDGEGRRTGSVSGDRSDAMGALYQAIESCAALLWAAPLYFASVPAQLKALIDRLQIYYGRRLLYGKPDAPRRPAVAVILGAGGDPFGAQAASVTLRSASQIAEFTLADPLVIFGADAPGDITGTRLAPERTAALALADSLQQRAEEWMRMQTQVSGDA